MNDLRRTHEERLASLREEFGRAKEIARASGKKNDCSINKICKAARVDKAYLLGHRLQEGSKYRDEYIKIGRAINEFRDNFDPGKDVSFDKARLAELKEAYEALLSDVEPLQKELAYMRSSSAGDMKMLEDARLRNTQLLARLDQLERERDLASKSRTTASSLPERVQRHLVSPDEFREAGGYKIGSKKAEQEIWTKAYNQLEALLSRKLKMRLYILVGIPCSGKTTWAETAQLCSDRHPVIFDATNLTSMDRFTLVRALGRFDDLPKACVYFDTDMAVVRERNRTKRASNRQLSDSELDLMKRRIEKPDPYEEPWIDELIVVRQNG